MTPFNPELVDTQSPAASQAPEQSDTPPTLETFGFRISEDIGAIFVIKTEGGGEHVIEITERSGENVLVKCLSSTHEQMHERDGVLNTTVIGRGDALEFYTDLDTGTRIVTTKIESIVRQEPAEEAEVPEEDHEGALESDDSDTDNA